MRKISLILLLAAFWSVCAHAKHFLVTSDVWEPFFIEEEGKHYGIGVDILREVFSRTGDTFTIRTFPVKRAKWLFDNGKVDLIAIDSPMWDDPNNAGNYIFSDTIMHVQEYIYFEEKSALEVTSPQGLANKVVGIRDGYQYPVFEQAFKDGTVLKHEVSSNMLLIRLLLANRIDAIFMDSVAFSYAAEMSGADKKWFFRGMELSDAEVGMKFTLDNASALPRINQAIAEIKNDGTLDKIIHKYTSSRIYTSPD